MAANCFSCKWNRLRENPSLRKSSGVSADEVKKACSECVEKFREYCRGNPKTCLTCPWKDPNLPYEARRTHCDACADAYAESRHDCAKCIWNDSRRPMPAAAAMNHCKRCLANETGKANNCSSCRWKDTPKSVRTRHCAACSLGFSSNPKIVGSTNELSNKGQIIESYDNHNSNMTDDRDTVMQIRKDYIHGLMTSRGHPVFTVAERGDMSIEEFAQNAYDLTKRFLYELSSLTDLQALLFLSTVRGEQKTDFAKRHNITDSAVNSLYKQVIVRSEIFKHFVILTKGTVKGTRGRKAKDPNAGIKVPKSTKKIVYCGLSQMSLPI